MDRWSGNKTGDVRHINNESVSTVKEWNIEITVWRGHTARNLGKNQYALICKVRPPVRSHFRLIVSTLKKKLDIMIWNPKMSESTEGMTTRSVSTGSNGPKK